MLKDKRWAYVLWTFRRKKDEILEVAEQRAGMFPARRSWDGAHTFREVV